MKRQTAMLWGSAALICVLFSPLAGRLADGMWPCVFKAITGFACPTCGTTRAAVLLSELDVWTALAHYPLPTVGWMVFIGGGMSVLFFALLGRTPPAIPSHLPTWARVSVVSAVLLNWAYSIATGV